MREHNTTGVTVLQRQALGVINVCKTALVGRARAPHPVDHQTVAVARAILDQAKAKLPDDKVLAATALGKHWTALQTAMEIVVSSPLSDNDSNIAEELKVAVARSRSFSSTSS